MERQDLIRADAFSYVDQLSDHGERPVAWAALSGFTFEREARQVGPRHRPLPVITQLIHIGEGNRPNQILSLHRAKPYATTPNQLRSNPNYAASNRTAQAMVSAASRCIPDITCEYRCKVNSGEA